MELCHGSPQEAGMLPERINRARELCAQWVESGHTPAISVCVARRGIIVLHEAFGVLGPEPDAGPIDRRSLFPLSSVSKPVMATLVMQLVEDGLIGLNRPVLDYIPEIPAAGAEDMLVHHLLTHTAGYTWYDEEPFASHALRKLSAGYQPPACAANQHPQHATLIDLFMDAPLARRPGEIMIYSNHNYELLSEIVRRVTGRPHWEIAQERVFDPLGMNDCFYIVPEAEVGRVVGRPLDSVGGAPENPLNQGIASRQMQEMPFGGGGIFGTPRDIVTLGQMFLNGGVYGGARVLSAASVAAMTRDQIPGTKALFIGHERERAGWGYGWGIETPTKWKQYRGGLRSLGSYDHGGYGGTFTWVDPAQQIVAAYFEVTLRMNETKTEQYWNADLFQDVITAAVEE
jgi:CubicO group peptidase (beta-lactamase class C family)